MNRLTRASIRYHGRRYVATGVGVAIAVAFVFATIIFGQGMGASLRNAFFGETKDADAMIYFVGVESAYGESFADVMQVLENVEGVESVQAVGGVYTNLSHEGVDTTGIQSYASIVAPESARMVAFDQGTAPETERDVALYAPLAERLGVSVGDPVYAEDTGEQFVVSGLFEKEATQSIVSTSAPTTSVYVTEHGMARLDSSFLAEQYAVYGQGDLDEAGQDALTDAIRDAFRAQGWVGESVDGGEDEVEFYYYSITQGYAYQEAVYAMVQGASAMITASLMAFPLISTLVAMVIVSSTFQVIVKQRQRELALLRCVGATSKQVKRMILGESAAVGAVGSIVGLILGTAVGVGVVTWIGATRNLGEAVALVPWLAALIVFVVGVLFTVLAGLRPAALAGRSRPIEALNQSSLADPVARKPRLIRNILSFLVLALSLGATIVLLYRDDPEGDVDTRVFTWSLLLCTVAAIALISLMSSYLPSLTAGIGKLFRGMVWKMAALNTARNPKRTAATGLSLFIGVTLISMFLVGGQSIRETVLGELDENAPVDLLVGNPDAQIISPDVAQAITEVEGVAASSTMYGIVSELTINYGDEDISGVALSSAAIVTAEGLDQVVRANDYTPPEAGQILLPWWVLGGEDTPTAEACLGATCLDLQPISTPLVDSLSVLGSSADYTYLLVSQETMDALTSSPYVLGVALQLEDPVNYQSTLADIQDINSSLFYGGGVGYRVSVLNAVSAFLMVVIALLAVSVVVALVGVSNTLSLSVMERAQENALLRAVGMSKKQMAGMLTVESVVIALVAVILGVAAGVCFGIIGLYAMPLSMEIVLSIPWLQLGGVVVVAFLAAVLAALLPGYRAARVSPVEALASL